MGIGLTIHGNSTGKIKSGVGSGSILKVVSGINASGEGQDTNDESQRKESAPMGNKLRKSNDGFFIVSGFTNSLGKSSRTLKFFLFCSRLKETRW